MKKTFVPLFCINLILFSFQTNDYGEVKTFQNLDASDKQGKRTYFSFEKGDVVSAEENWDLAFSKTSVFVKGSYTSLEKNFNDVKIIPAEAQFSQPSENTVFQDWYEYTGAPAHLVLPKPNKTYLISLSEGKRYAKLEIISYYKDAPKEPDALANKSGFYTFRYVYKAKGNKEF